MIKKSVMALILISALLVTPAAAQTELYGSIRYGVEFGYNHGTPKSWRQQSAYLGTYAPFKNEGRRGLNVRDEGSLIGLKGQENLGNDIKVIYQLEWNFNGVEGLSLGSGFENAFAYIGLAGPFGTFTIGRLENPFTLMMAENTAFDDSNSGWLSGTLAATGDVFFGEMGSINTFDASMVDNLGNSISYTTPELGGFSFSLLGMMDEVKTADEEDQAQWGKKRSLDLWNINATYAHEVGFYAGLGYITATMSDRRAHAYGLHLGFRNEHWGVNANLARGQNKGPENFGIGNNRSAAFWAMQQDAANDTYKHTTSGWDLGGQFSFGADYASTLRLSVGQAKADKKHQEAYTFTGIDNKETNKMTTWALGFEQKLSTRTRTWIEYENTQVRQTFRSRDHYGDSDYQYGALRSTKYKDDRVNVGIRHDF